MLGYYPPGVLPLGDITVPAVPGDRMDVRWERREIALGEENRTMTVRAVLGEEVLEEGRSLQQRPRRGVR